MLFLFGYANLDVFWGTYGIIVTGVSRMLNTVVYLLFIFLVLSLAEETGAFQKLTEFISRFAKNERSAEATCGVFVCLSCALLTSGISTMGFCGPLVTKILDRYKIPPRRYPAQKLRRINQRRSRLPENNFVLPLAEASIAFVWTSASAGAQTFAVCGALPHTLFFLNFLITPRV